MPKAAIDIAHFNAGELAYNDGYPTITRCLFCDWTHEGPALEGRNQAKKHRARKHKTIPARSYNDRAHKRFQKIKASELSPEDQAVIAYEVAKRRRLAGVDG